MGEQRRPASAAILSFAVEVWPVLELEGVEFAVQIGRMPLHARLRVGNGAVVDDWPNFFEEEIEKATGRQVAKGVRHVFLEVAFDGRDRIGASF